jgi:hypothetical protein
MQLLGLGAAENLQSLRWHPPEAYDPDPLSATVPGKLLTKPS